MHLQFLSTIINKRGGHNKTAKRRHLPRVACSLAQPRHYHSLNSYDVNFVLIGVLTVHLSLQLFRNQPWQK